MLRRSGSKPGGPGEYTRLRSVIDSRKEVPFVESMELMQGNCRGILRGCDRLRAAAPMKCA